MSNTVLRAGVVGALVVGLLAACGSGVANSGSSKLAVEHTLAHSCVAIGGKQTVTARTEPKVNIAFVPKYADSLIHGDTPKGYTDDRGVFKRSWVVPSEAPAGSVDLRIIAAKGRQSANIGVTFEVVAEGATCP